MAVTSVRRMAGGPARPLSGILWMVAAGLCFVGMTVAVKSIGDTIPAPQGAFLRFVFGLALFLPVAGRLWAERPRGRDVWFFGLRGVVHTIAVITWFYAIARIPLAEVTAINYLTPVFVTLGAALLLGETIAFRRIAAICVALIGALVILRPGFRELGSGHLAMVCTAVGLGSSYLIAKGLSSRYSASAIVGWMSLLVTLGLLPIALSVWVAPTLWQLAIYVVCAACATSGHYAMTRSFSAAPVAVSQPATFLQLVWAVSLGVLLFGEPVDPWVVLGGSVIVAAVSFIAWREHRRRTAGAG